MAEEVTATQAARAIAAEAGIEHDMGAIGGAGMPVTKGRSPKAAGTLEEPEYTVNTVGDHLFTWEDQFTKELIRIKVSHPARSGRDFWCVVTVMIRQKGKPTVSIFTKKQWNLTSVSGGTSIATALNKREPERNWDGRLALVEQYVHDKVETGDDLLELSTVVDPPPTSYAVYPFLEENANNMIGADGGSTKSIAALAWCVAYTYGIETMPGIQMPTDRRPSLYLDYEGTSDTQAFRRRGILAGVDATELNGMVYYKRMYSPIADAVTELYDIIKSRNIGLVVIDSGSRAVGGGTNEESVVIPYFNAISSWGVTTLTIVHKSKEAIQKGGSGGPSGVKQWWNQTRNYWELLKDQTPGQSELYVAFRHDKSNNDARHDPMNYKIDFSGGIKYHLDTEVKSQEIRNELPKHQQIMLWLRENGDPATAAEIAEGTGMSSNHVSNELRKNEGRHFFGSSDKRDRRWNLIEGRQEELDEWET